jgi:hypothetical protein
MSEHRFAGAEFDDEPDVRRVQPYQATKTYRCPGCDHPIPPGTGHVVVVPRDADDRRHWHTACWARATRPPARPARTDRTRRR